MRFSHHTGIVALVVLTGLAAIGIVMFGSPQTGMIPQGSRYLSESAGIGQDVHLRAAEVCYPNRRRFERYSTCCSQPCVDECHKARASDIKACQTVCQNWCIKAVTEVYLERPVGFVGASSKGRNQQQYTVYTT